MMNLGYIQDNRALIFGRKSGLRVEEQLFELSYSCIDPKSSL